MDEEPRIPRVLSIAGSDSGGGAGIQADLKAFARCGVHGMTAITAITAQNTVGVDAVDPVAPGTIVAQVRSVAGDIGVDAVKIGMLGSRETIEAVVQALDLLPEGTPVVVDPVMVAESGADLLDPEARDALVERILPRATVATPNIAEAARLAGVPADTDPEELARAVHALGPAYVVVTGGHRPEAMDVFFDGSAITPIPGSGIPVGRPTGRVAPTPRLWRRTSRWASSHSPPRAGRRRSPPPRCATGCVTSGPDRVPSTRSVWGTARRWHNSARYEVPAHEARTRRGADRRG